MKIVTICCLIFCLIVMVVVTKSVAQDKTEKVIHAVRIEPNETPKIDGKLDDECWKKADNLS